MKKWLLALSIFFATAAHAENVTLQSHAFAIGKGPGVSGYKALLCGAGTLPIGQAAADPSCIALSGDATISAAGVLTLATVNANVGAFGSATQCATTTVNAKGLTTAASQATCTPAVGSITGLGTGVATALGVNIGSAGAPVLFNGAGGTPSSLTLTNATGLPVTALAGAGTGVVTALGVNVGSAGAVVVNGGALGTPSSGTLTNATGLPVGGVTGMGTGCGTFLATPSSANLRGCLTDESGTGVAYFQGGDVGTPSAGVATNITALNATQLTTGTVPAARLPNPSASTLGGIQSLTCAANQWLNTISTSGVPACAQPATTNLSDAVTDTAWTPIDSSGASLSFTTVTGRYTRMGKMVTAFFNLTFPATGSGLAATIGGLPVAASASYPAASVPVATGTCSNSVITNTVFALIIANATSVTLFTQVSGQQTNANLTASRVSCTITYISQ